MLTPKFVRAHYAPSVAGTRGALQYMLKVVHEFWGFCVNGDNDLTGAVGSHKGFASGGINMASNFENGFLHASGSDGTTNQNFPFFSSSTGNFTSSAIIGKHLVLWKSGSTSTDDSIYEITQLINTTTIRVNTFNGATPVTSSFNRPFFTQRSNINYRIVDLGATALLTHVSGNNLVLNVNGAPLVNSGSNKCQVKLGLAFGASANSLRMTISPSGSWNGSAFTDGKEFAITTGHISDWGTKTALVSSSLAMIGAQDFLFAHMQGDLWQATVGQIQPSGFMFEIPERLYPQQFDPNLITGQMFSSQVATNDAQQGFNAWRMVGYDGEQRRWTVLVRGLTGGCGWGPQFTSNYLGTVNERYLNVGFNQFTRTVPFLEAVLSLPSQTGQYSLARARLRRTRFSPNSLQRNTLAGDSIGNMWYHFIDTIWIPWDNTKIPNGMFPFGEST